jgi:integrase
MTGKGASHGKRGAGEGSYRLRTDGRWEVRFTSSNGRSKSLYGKTRQEVQKKHRAALRDLDNGLDLDAGRQTTEQFLMQWLEKSVEPTVRTSTYRHYEQIVRVHIVPSLGRVRLDKLTPLQVQHLLNEKAKAGLAPRTVGHVRAVLRNALNQALRWGLVTRNAAELSAPPRQPKSPVKPLTAEQARAFLEFSKADRLGPLFAAALSTGMRQGELLGLRWEDIDFERRTVSVRRALQRVDGEPTFVEPKSESSRRMITVPTAALDAFRDQQARQRERRLLSGDRWQDWELVFTATNGAPLEQSNVTHRLQKLLNEAGLPRQRFHDLRHACASLLLEAGVPARTIMGMLGHSQISLTLNTYAHLSPTLERDAAEAIDRMLAGEGQRAKPGDVGAARRVGGKSSRREPRVRQVPGDERFDEPVDPVAS